MNMWFWFFEARNSPANAPVAIWLNGGPGCSSMIGLFQENGPCHFVGGSSTPTLNPYSWNTYANMLYIDQPIGVGFSYGTNNVTSTVNAAPHVWTFLQAFFASFPQYKSRDFGLFTESYGGHYGPQFAAHFQEQNKKVDDGTIRADKVNLVALGINNGWIDPPIQFKAYIDYSFNNSYRQLITRTEYNTYINTFNRGCGPALQTCPGPTGSNSACLSADNTCNDQIYYPLSEEADFNVYDIRNPSNDPNPPQTYVNYLKRSAVTSAIGAQAAYQECPDTPYNKIINTGDGQ
jgi:carboxypeptidase C (cathepsin A)